MGFDVMFCISSWSSTFAFAILFKNLSRTEFYTICKDKFKNKLKVSVLLIVSAIQTFIFLMILFVVSKNSEVDSIFTVSSWGMLIYFFVKNFLAGPLGEELGWRGFAQIELQKKYSPLKASIIIGFWWGCGIYLFGLLQDFWHGPNEIYSVFMISIICIKIVMTAFYNLNQI